MDDKISERVKELRLAMGISQTKMATDLGIGQASLWAMEAGQRSIKERHLKLLTGVYGVNESWLKTGEGPMFVPMDTTEKAELPPKKQALLNAVAGLSDHQIDVLADVVSVIANQVLAIDGNKKSPAPKGKA